MNVWCVICLSYTVYVRQYQNTPVADFVVHIMHFESITQRDVCIAIGPEAIWHYMLWCSTKSAVQSVQHKWNMYLQNLLCARTPLVSKAFQAYKQIN